MRAGETPIYRTDPLVRRSLPLQKTRDGRQAHATMCAAELERHQLADGDTVYLRQGAASAKLPVHRDDTVPDGCVWVPLGFAETQTLGELNAPIEVSKA